MYVDDMSKDEARDMLRQADELGLDDWDRDDLRERLTWTD